MKKLSLLVICLFFTSAKAEPWIDTRDAWLRADIEFLSDIGIIKAPVTTWPLMWAPILNDLNNADINELSNSELRVYKRVKRKGKFETKLDTHSYLSLKAGNQGKILRHFGDDRREKAEVTSKTTGMSKNFAWNIEATRAFDPIDGEEQRLDSSYVAGIWGNWVVSLGAQERWWGPGWDTSLILSNNARPVPAISVQRNYSDPFESKWLSWIGPWTFTAFAGQLERDRHIPHTKLLGMSINFKPLDSLEVGLRRTAQWGGEGRPQSLSNLFNLLVGRDNCEEDGLSCLNQTNEPGNQLAGIDFLFQIPGISKAGSFYGQYIGEDEAGYLPSRKIVQLGYKKHITLFNGLGTIILEYSDTENDFIPNYTYNHGIYQTGYRTHGRAIGSSYDNDTESFSFGFIGRDTDYGRYIWKLSSIDLNSDDVSGRNSVSSSNVNLIELELKYETSIGNSLLGLSAELRDRAITFGNNDISKFDIGISWTLKL